MKIEKQLPQARILIVFEFCESPQETMVPEVRDELEKRGARVAYLQGIFRQYRPGGLGWTRFLNYGWMALALPWRLLSVRPTQVLVRSTPPGIQIWVALWMKLFRRKGVLWLMDYHPEIEARGLENRGKFGRVVALWLRKIDRWSQGAYSKIVVPDAAMEEAVRANSSQAEIVVFPTWKTGAERRTPSKEQETTNRESRTSINERRTANEEQRTKILYCGNLGSGHDLEEFERWTALVATNIHLFTVGTGDAGQSRFRELADRSQNLAWTHWGALSDEELQRRSGEEGVDFGLVLMKEQWAGLMSPSKYATYLKLSLPILYFGPRHTNADRVCREFGGGCSFCGSDFSEEQFLQIFNQKEYARRMEGVRRAYSYFAAKNAAEFVRTVL
ncbi:glycosyltransferase family protein [Puniceicoccus vermicola]|uniref:Glycosyltransferase family 4 protein n=1 Tax=Puniceicoccus vermicola TaxID=388746 RepID=A0A7X1AWI4_9BACT|nr:hypothetical protein [Puniceicoccus vermicola]MBC2601199.1 hypothetical protein [Puniceicoccus vermicola]